MAKLSGNGNFTALIVKASSSRKLVLSNQQYLRAYSRTEAPDSCGDLEDYYEADEKQEFSTRNCPDQSSRGKLFDRCGWRLSKFRKVWSCSKSQNNEMVCRIFASIIKNTVALLKYSNHSFKPCFLLVAETPFNSIVSSKVISVKISYFLE